MIICEHEFDQPDRDNPDYSQTEVDYYSHIPYPMAQETGVGQHRLSLRKNLKTGEYEIYRAWAKSYLVSRRQTTVMGETETGDTEIVFTGDLQGAIDYATKETNRFWASVHGEEREIDQVCQHKPPVQHWLCEKFQRRMKGAVP